MSTVVLVISMSLSQREIIDIFHHVIVVADILKYAQHYMEIIVVVRLASRSYLMH